MAKKDDTKKATDNKRQLVWDSSKMTTNFANVVNMQSTQEQIDLFFGTNQTWNASGGSDVVIELTNRIILNPHAAKRLWSSLGAVLEEYESKYSSLSIEAPATKQ